MKATSQTKAIAILTINRHSARSLVALAVIAMLGFSNLAVIAHPGPHALSAQAQKTQETPKSATAQETQETPKIPNDQLDSLVAPIALYPDPLLAQTLAASTYPLELVQLQQWLEKNQAIAKDQTKLTEAVQKQPWDASIQAMAPLPTW